MSVVRQSSGAGDGAIEAIYQKKTQLEHILIRPDTYVGSTEKTTQEMWVVDDVSDDVNGGADDANNGSSDDERRPLTRPKMVRRPITYVPALYKIFDEILVNAADNKQRDSSMSTVKVTIDPDRNLITIYNDGRGIPVTMHKTEKMYVPTLIFGHLLTSSNFNDNQKKVTGGRNGYGAKLCNVFSTEFTVETSCKQFGHCFKQTWRQNMTVPDEPKIEASRKVDFTRITFRPDLAKFHMDLLDPDIVSLFKRRVYDIAASVPGISVYLNGRKLPINRFEDYVRLYTQECVDEANNPLNVIYHKFNARWEVAVTISEGGFQQMSFVNSIATTKGGKHVDYVVDQIVNKLNDTVKKKNKSGSDIKPHQLKNYLWVFVNCLIENPTFDSQTKEFMTLTNRNFGSKCDITEDFIKKVKDKCGVVESVLRWVEFKQKTLLEKKGGGSKTTKLKGIPKLDDANDAGTRNSARCTLIVTEGDSAKTLAVSGLGIIGRDHYGVFPLRGKLLNVREANTKQIMQNQEITNLCKILGLQYKEKYEKSDDLKKLRYGKLMIMADQDHDGSHIKGLVINFIHHNWPNLLKHGFVNEFITPIVKAFKGSNELMFYSEPEFQEWQELTPDWMRWRIKYYKGLGTSTSKEAKEYFSNMQRHKIDFRYQGARDDLSIQLAFSKNLSDDRKDWLTRFMSDRKHRREQNLPTNEYLYQKTTKEITYSDFVNKELILFSNLDNERSLPSMMDGFKPGQRKVLYSCFKRNLVKELKVAQLAGSVAELSAYHHGEQSLMSTIINLAQDFVGSNNINVLLPIGQFGTRMMGGKDAASPRYIFTALNPITRFIFSKLDDPILNYLNDDGQLVEPEWYCPVIPMILVNGADGIGTGWSTRVPNYNPREIIENLKLIMCDREPKPMLPYYRGFRGTAQLVDCSKVVMNGEIAEIDANAYEITELPIGEWTQSYKDKTLELLLTGVAVSESGAGGGRGTAAANRATNAANSATTPLISDFKDYNTDTTVRFVVKMTNEQISKVRKQGGFHKVFKLQKPISLCNMVMFDADGCLQRYDGPLDVLKDFYRVRLGMYVKRKEYLIGLLEAESRKLDNTARFILEKIEGTIKIENVKKVVILQVLKERKFDPDPVKRWKLKQKSNPMEAGASNKQEGDDGDDGEDDTSAADYEYLLGLPLWSLTMERKDALLKDQASKAAELRVLRAKTEKDLWKEDLDNLLVEFDKFEAGAIAVSQKKQAKAPAGRKRENRIDTQPTKDAIRINPPEIAAANGVGGNKNIVDSLLGPEDSRPAPAAAVNKRKSVKKTNIVDAVMGDDNKACEGLLVERATKRVGKAGEKSKTSRMDKDIRSFMGSNERSGDDCGRQKRTEMKNSGDEDEEEEEESGENKRKRAASKKEPSKKRAKHPSEDDDDEETNNPPPPREKRARNAGTTKKCYVISSDEAQENENDSDFSIDE